MNKTQLERVPTSQRTGFEAVHESSHRELKKLYNVMCKK